MEDRVSKYPGRVLITPESGAAPFYATVTRADEPTQPGDPMSKSTFLKDATAALFGLGSTAVPNDVFALIPFLLDELKDEVLSIPRTTVKVGSYVGKGKSDSLANANTLEFDFKPMFIVIYSPYDWEGAAGRCSPILMIRGNNGIACATLNWGYNTAVWEGNSVSWYGNSPEHQCNVLGETYAYFAIGVLEIQEVSENE